MVLLLDTHVLLWALDAPERLPPGAIAQLESPETAVYFSAASIWEIAIKTTLGKIDFTYPPEAIAQAARDTGFVELPVRAEHGAMVARLPLHHRDPFDRLLIAQALLLPAQLVTADAALVPYTELVRRIQPRWLNSGGTELPSCHRTGDDVMTS